MNKIFEKKIWKQNSNCLNNTQNRPILTFCCLFLFFFLLLVSFVVDFWSSAGEARVRGRVYIFIFLFVCFYFKERFNFESLISLFKAVFTYELFLLLLLLLFNFVPFLQLKITFFKFDSFLRNFLYSISTKTKTMTFSALLLLIEDSLER